eukprot:1148335-Pelagomonas_calceolata.AAC.2
MKGAESETDAKHICWLCGTMQGTDGQGPQVLAYTQVKVHTHNEQDCTLDKNDHTVAVNIQHCPHRLSMMHTKCKTMFTIVTMGFDLRPGSLAARPA